MRRPVVLAALACLSVVAGCRTEIETIYGRRSGSGLKSVNGTAVLADMFHRAGHVVFTRSSLSPKLRQRADCIVWFPDDFQPPSPAVRAWLEDWLTAVPGRTLVYVGRDFDAAPKYWQAIKPMALAGQGGEIERLRQRAEARFAAERAGLLGGGDCRWFRVDVKPKPRMAKNLDAEQRWLEGVDPAGVEIELNSRIVPPPNAELLLRSDEDVLVSRQGIGRSGLIVVANGSFLLNLQLVNHEHRKLAGHLIDEIGPPRKDVVFLQSFAGGPRIREQDPSAAAPSGLEMFNVWPTNWILLHLALVGIVFCFARLPIFGRPLEPEPAGLADFGKHIEAVGQWLARSRDYQYAAKRLAHYQQVKKKDDDPHPARPPAAQHP